MKAGGGETIRKNGTKLVWGINLVSGTVSKNPGIMVTSV